MRKNTLYTLIFSLCASLSACSSSQSTLASTVGVSEGVAATSSFHNNPQLLAEQAKHASGDQAVASQLQAANELIRQRQYPLAADLLDHMDNAQLSSADFAQQQLLYARLYLTQDRANDSVHALQLIKNPDDLSKELHISYLEISATTEAKLGQQVNSIKMRIQLAELLPDNQQKQNLIIIWKQTQQLPTQTLKTLSQDQAQSTLAGWAKLTLIIQQYGSGATKELATQLQHWQEQYPKHPANQLLPASFEKDADKNQATAQVALLLPMQGPFKDQAEAVMNGFLIAYHELPRDQQPKLRIYDTSKSDNSVTDLYKQAVSDGAQFVVGPLTKPEVQAVINHGSCAVPTLLLNYTQADDQLPSNCYEFSISPANEAVQAATRAWSSNYDHAVIISPQGEWGLSIANSFKNQWHMQGGRVVAELDFDQQQSLAKQISALMGIDGSNQRILQLRRVLGQKIISLPRPRQDIGVIFINASNAQARQIVPLLKFNFSGKTPIFATSLIYNGIPSPTSDRDLNGVRFLVMPWSMQNSAEQQQLAQLWPSNFHNNNKLYALGIDSLRLMQQLPRMQLFSQFAITGVTGKLTLQPNQQITQQMLWAQFVGGQPKLFTKKLTHGH